MANDTAYGLAAAIFTQDLNRAVRVAHAVEAGTVWVWLSFVSESAMFNISPG